MKSRIEIKQQAKNNFTAQYGLCLGTFIVYMILMGAVGGITAGIGTIFVGLPLMVGYASFNLSVYRGETPDIGDMFSNGFSGYWNKVAGMLLVGIFTFLWALLFIVPGIIKALAYSMTPYLLAEYEDIDPTEARKLSIRMTNGYKGMIFVTVLSFIGWLLLSALTFGLLNIFFTGPYFNATLAGVYDKLKKKALEAGTVTLEELG